jgi:serine/threonine protein kinase
VGDQSAAGSSESEAVLGVVKRPVAYPGVPVGGVPVPEPIDTPRRRGRGAARRLGSRYLLHEPLGRGAMGEVFRGSVRGMREAVAIKVLRAELAADPETVARFVQERSILTELRHPHIVAVEDLVVEGDTLAIVMELVVGSDLRRHLRKHHTLPATTAVDLIIQLLDGLEAVHAAGVVHRDLKPENVLLEQSGNVTFVRLGDFGVSRIAGATLARLTGAIGTPEYMAPELLRGQPASPASDLYAVGIMLYELLAGHTPFAAGDVFAVIRGHGEQAPARPEGVPDQLWRLISRLLEKDPDDRPKSAAAAGAGLRRLLSVLAGTTAEALLDDENDANVEAGATQRLAAVAADVSTPAVDRPTERLRPDPSSLAPGRPATSLRRVVGIAGLAAVLVVVATFGVLHFTGGHLATPATAATTPASFTFAPYTEDGLLVSRSWTMATNGSSLAVALKAINPSSQVIALPAVDEVIPKSLALSTSRLTLPEATNILQQDPAVRFNSAQPLASSGLVEFTYRVALSRSTDTTANRLSAWAKDQATAQTAWIGQHSADAVTTLTSLSGLPASLSLAPGQMQSVAVSGLMSDGTSASPALDAMLKWSSSAPSVAAASGGTVVGLRAGTAVITAAAGTVAARVLVTVGLGATATPSAPASPSTPLATGGPSTGPSVATIFPTTPPAGRPTATPRQTPYPIPTPYPTPPPSPPPPSISQYDTSFENGLPQGWTINWGPNQILCGSTYAPENGNCIDRVTILGSGQGGSADYQIPYQAAAGQTLQANIFVRGGSNCPQSTGDYAGQFLSLSVGRTGGSALAQANVVAGGGWTDISVSLAVAVGGGTVTIEFNTGCDVDLDNVTFSAM